MDLSPFLDFSHVNCLFLDFKIFLESGPRMLTLHRNAKPVPAGYPDLPTPGVSACCHPDWRPPVGRFRHSSSIAYDRWNPRPGHPECAGSQRWQFPSLCHPNLLSGSGSRRHRTSRVSLDSSTWVVKDSYKGIFCQEKLRDLWNLFLLFISEYIAIPLPFTYSTSRWYPWSLASTALAFASTVPTSRWYPWPYRVYCIYVKMIFMELLSTESTKNINMISM